MDNHIVGTTHQGLSLTILIPVIEDEVELLIGTGHHIRPHINPPQTGTVHLVALMQVEVIGVALSTQVTTIVTTLHDKLHLAVAVDIGHRAVIKGIT